MHIKNGQFCSLAFISQLKKIDVFFLRWWNKFPSLSVRPQKLNYRRSQRHQKPGGDPIPPRNWGCDPACRCRASRSPHRWPNHTHCGRHRPCGQRWALHCPLPGNRYASLAEWMFLKGKRDEFLAFTNTVSFWLRMWCLGASVAQGGYSINCLVPKRGLLWQPSQAIHVCVWSSLRDEHLSEHLLGLIQLIHWLSINSISGLLLKIADRKAVYGLK